MTKISDLTDKVAHNTLPKPLLNRYFVKGLCEEEVTQLQNSFVRARPFVHKINLRVYKDLLVLRRKLESADVNSADELRELVGQIKALRRVLNYSISDKEIPDTIE